MFSLASDRHILNKTFKSHFIQFNIRKQSFFLHPSKIHAIHRKSTHLIQGTRQFKFQNFPTAVNIWNLFIARLWWAKVFMWKYNRCQSASIILRMPFTLPCLWNLGIVHGNRWHFYFLLLANWICVCVGFLSLCGIVWNVAKNHDIFLFALTATKTNQQLAYFVLKT